MSGVWGENINLSIFGESHGKGIGVIIGGLSAGVELDIDLINKEMSRRAPGKNQFSTSRKECDKFEIISGYFNNRTTGSPLCVVINNTSQRSKDYEAMKDIIRPGHADYTGKIKYLGFNDYRGGGHFSGRLTAPLVFAGAIARQLLEKRSIIIGSHILHIGKIHDDFFDYVKINDDMFRKLKLRDFPVIDIEKGEEMREQILAVKEEKDSLGGIVETAVLNLPPGVGAPFFDSVESKIAHLLFSIPAVKGVEFGAGFSLASMKGSEANDPFVIQNDEVKTETNNNGGILGGITNGMPLIFRTAFKPTPSIGRLQKTVDVAKKTNIDLEIEGRHDPCIVPRAVPVVEAAAMLALLDLLMEKEGKAWMI